MPNAKKIIKNSIIEKRKNICVKISQKVKEYENKYSEILNSITITNVPNYVGVYIPKRSGEKFGINFTESNEEELTKRLSLEIKLNREDKKIVHNVIEQYIHGENAAIEKKASQMHNVAIKVDRNKLFDKIMDKCLKDYNFSARFLLYMPKDITEPVNKYIDCGLEYFDMFVYLGIEKEYRALTDDFFYVLYITDIDDLIENNIRFLSQSILFHSVKYLLDKNIFAQKIVDKEYITDGMKPFMKYFKITDKEFASWKLSKIIN